MSKIKASPGESSNLQTHLSSERRAIARSTFPWQHKSVPSHTVWPGFPEHRDGRRRLENADWGKEPGRSNVAKVDTDFIGGGYLFFRKGSLQLFFYIDMFFLLLYFFFC